MKTKILANGLKTVAIKNPSSDVVSIQVWISCGSANEKEKEYGVSHFIEHLLFKGTEKHSVGDIAREVESLGGDLNAFTAKEYTCYYVTLPSVYLEQGLKTLKDLVYGPTFIKEEIDSEREVIVEEIRRYQDIPSSVASENFFEIHFDKHPYSKPILGFEEVIRNISREEILGYYSRFYTPSNSLVMICGNIASREETFKLVDDIFGDIKKGANPEQKIPVAEQKTDQSCKIHNMDVNEINLIFGFPIPELTHDDVPALDILGLVLGQGDSSRLVKSLRLEKGIVTSISSYAYTPKYGGAFNISFSVEGTSGNSKSTFKEIFSLIYDDIIKLKGDLDLSEIDKAKTIILSEKVYEREKVEGLATKLGHLICTTGGIEFEKQYFDRLRKITRDDIIKVLDKYIDRTKVSISAVLPKQDKITEGELLKLFDDSFKQTDKRTVIPRDKDLLYSSKTSMVDGITADSDYDFEENIIVKDPEIIHHPSGARIILRKINSTPLASMKVIVPGGVIVEDESNHGISNLLARTIMFGADDLSFSDIANIIDSSASNLNTFSGRNSIGFNIEAMKPFFNEMLGVASKIILKPKFKQEYFNTEKKVIEDEIKAVQDNLSHYAKLLLLKTMYKKHPYRFEIFGTIENVRKFKRSDVIDFYKNILSPERMIFSVTGDFDKDHLIKWIDGLLSNIATSKVALPKIAEEPNQKENRITRFNKESKQAHIFVAYKTCGLISRDRLPLSLIYAVLGGQSGRLFIDLRDKQSLAYTVAPIELYGPETGYFGAYIASENNKIDKAIEEIRKQIKKIKSEKITEEEIKRGKNFLIGRHAISMQSYSEQASTMGFDEMFGNGYRSMLDYSNDIMSVTAEEAKAVAVKYFKDGMENISIVSSK
jgi:zinc protease